MARPPPRRSRCARSSAGLLAVHDVDFTIPRGLDRQPDRSQRRRQDDVLQHAHRRLQADRRARRLRRRGRHRQASARDHRARHRPHISEHPPLPADVCARERPRGHALAAQGRHSGEHHPHTADQARGERGTRARAGAARVLRARRARRRSSRATCPTEISGGSRWREHSPRSPSCCCSTSRPPA